MTRAENGWHAHDICATISLVGNHRHWQKEAVHDKIGVGALLPLPMYSKCKPSPVLYPLPRATSVENNSCWAAIYQRTKRSQKPNASINLTSSV